MYSREHLVSLSACMFHSKRSGKEETKFKFMGCDLNIIEASFRRGVKELIVPFIADGH